MLLCSNALPVNNGQDMSLVMNFFKDGMLNRMIFLANFDSEITIRGLEQV